MPKAFAAKAAFYNNLMRFITISGSRGIATSGIVQHFLPETPAHVVKHALQQLRKEGRLTRWREGREDTWVSSAAQEQANRQQVEEEVVPTPVLPDLKIGIVKATGALRIQWQGLRIEIGVIEE